MPRDLVLPDVLRDTPRGWARLGDRIPPGFEQPPSHLYGSFRSIPGKGSPSGLTVICSDAPHAALDHPFEAIGDLEIGAAPGWWRHVSCVREGRLPSWNDVRAMKAAFIGEDRYAYMVFPDAAHYVSIHNGALHLYASHDADATAGNVLPDFTKGTGSI